LAHLAGSSSSRCFRYRLDHKPHRSRWFAERTLSSLLTSEVPVREFGPGRLTCRRDNKRPPRHRRFLSAELDGEGGMPWPRRSVRRDQHGLRNTRIPGSSRRLTAPRPPRDGKGLLRKIPRNTPLRREPGGYLLIAAS